MSSVKVMKHTLAVYITNKHTTIDNIKEPKDLEQLCFASEAIEVPSWIRAGTAHVEVFLNPREDVMAAQVDSMRDEQQLIRAKAQAEWQRLEDSINSMLCLDHKHEE